MLARRDIAARPSRRPGAVRRALARRPWLVAPVVVVALAAGAPASYGAFSAGTANNSTWGAAASFPTYPQSVSGDGPAFHHRSDDAPSFAPDGTAADSSGNNRPGTYQGPTDGPSTWYRFDDGSGTTAADSSGAVNPGTLGNGPTWSGGHVGTGAVSLDGSDDVVTAAGPAVDTSTSFTVSAWAYPTDTTYHRTLLSQDGTNASGFFLQYKPTVDRWVFHMPDGDSTSGASAQAESRFPPTLNRWTHLAAVYDDPADEIRLYVDGTLVRRIAKTADWAATGPLVVGGARWGAGTRVDHFKGRIDDVRTYRRALSGPEIAGVYAQPAGWWTFDPVSLAQPDASGNGNDATLTGTPTFSAGGVNMSGDDHATAPRRGVHTDRSFTVAASVMPTSATGVLAVASQPGTTASAFTLTSNAGAWQFTLTGSDTASPGTAVATAGTAATANVTAHVVGVYSDEADEVRIYVNGKLEDTTPATADWNADGAFNAGRLLSGGAYSGYFQGRIYDLRVFGQALGNDDVYDLAQAPAARYDFDQNTATPAHDGGGNGRHLTRPSGTTSWVASGHRGGAMNFASSGYLRSAGPVLDTSASYSVSAWVYLTASGAYNRTAVSQDGANTSAFFLQHYNSESNNAWAFQVRPTDSTANGGAALSAINSAVQNRWTHLVGVYDDAADAVRLYVNGSLAGTATLTSDFAATGSLNLGSSLYGGVRGDFWPGNLDGVAVYQKVLTAADVSTLYGQAPSVRWDVNENAGTTVGDRSGAGNNGSVYNGPVWTTGREGSALSFDAVDDEVRAAAPIRTDTSFTVSAWVYLTDTGATRIAASQNGSYAYAYALGYGSASGKWVFSMTSGDSTSPAVLTAASGVAPVTGTWTHLTGVYDDAADRIRLYVNGALEGTATVTTDWNATNVMILGWAGVSGSPTYRWQGRIDEVSVFRRPLRDTEVQGLFGFYALPPAPNAPHAPTMTAGQTGALQGPQQGQASSTAMAFNGLGNAYNPVAFTNPAPFTAEAWFRVGGTAGGAILGFGAARTGTGGNRDRLLYVDSGGRISFGVYPGSAQVVRSAAAYNDGAWHHVAASLGPAGMRLYVDGAPVASDAAVTTAENFTGYWRWGGADLGGWPNRPASDLFVGTLDEVAVYPAQLTDQQIARHHAANH